jgi:DNA-binding protein YbaB
MISRSADDTPWLRECDRFHHVRATAAVCWGAEDHGEEGLTASMGDPLADSLSMIENWERNATEKAAKFQAMADRVAEVSITESVAGGAVSATVGNNGIPTDIAMTDRVREMAPDEIAANVMAAIRKAQSRYPRALAAIVAETVGDDPAGQHVIATAEQNFPAPDEDEAEVPDEGIDFNDIEDDDTSTPQPTPPPRPSTRDSNNDDGDFGDESVFR